MGAVNQVAICLCMFLDERFERTPKGERFIVGCIVVEEACWKIAYQQAKDIPQLRKSRRLREISKLLMSSGGFGRVTIADMPSGLIQAGQRDETEDIPNMSRRDNVWSILVATVAMAVLRRLNDHGINSASIDLYHDSKSLTPKHSFALNQLLREQLPRIARELTGGSSAYRKVCEVRKSMSGPPASEIQVGTLIAHHLCSQAKKLLTDGPLSRIEFRDESEILVASAMLFEAF